MKANNTFCKHAFTGLAIKRYTSQGKLISAWPCCMMGNPVGNDRDENRLKLDSEKIAEMSPEEIYNHPRMQQLRKNLANGVKDSACKVCWDQEDRGIKSFRQYSNDLVGGIELSKKQKRQIIDNHSLETIDMSTGNACNLRCRMCDTSASSQLKKDFNFFKKNNLFDDAEYAISRFTKNPNSFAFNVNDIKQWEWIYNNGDKFKFLRLSGGEPFYDQRVISFIDKCIEKGWNETLTLEFHTNGTLFTQELLDKIKQFKCNLQFSIDGTGKVYEYIRYPQPWTELDKSIRMYNDNVTTDFFEVSMVVQLCNLFNIPSYIEWLTNLNHEHVAVSFSEIYTSDRGVALYHMPKDLLQRAKDEILEAGEKTYLRVHGAVQQIDDAIANNRENRHKAFTEINLFDMSRKQSYKDFLDKRVVDWLTN